jgi:hypothetical protein
MKIQKMCVVLLAAALLAACSPNEPIAESSATASAEATSEDSSSSSESSVDHSPKAIDDDFGSGWTFGSEVVTPHAGSSEAQIKTDIGVAPQIANDGSVATLRFLVACSDYTDLSKASFVRAAYTNASGEAIAEETAEVSAIYTTLKDPSSIKWENPLTEEFTSYVAYSLKDLPQADFFTVFTVNFSAETLEGKALKTNSQKANVEGAIGDLSVNAKYVLSKDDAATVALDPNLPIELQGKDDIYGATVSDTTAQSVTIAPYVMTIEGFVATKLGTVRYPAAQSATVGAFMNCGSLSQVALPWTMTYLTSNFLYKETGVTHWTLPAGITAVSPTAFASDNIYQLYYQATALKVEAALTQSITYRAYVSHNVQSMPDFFYPANKEPNRVFYDGTKAEWETIEGSKANGFNVPYLVCNDSKMVTVNFHFEGGTLSTSQGKYTDIYTLQVLTGFSVSDPGVAAFKNKIFKGWFTDATYSTAYTFDVALVVPEDQTGMTVDIYAKFVDGVAGCSSDLAVSLVLDGPEASYTLNGADFSTYWFKYTAPADWTYADRVYLKAVPVAPTSTNYCRVNSYNAQMQQLDFAVLFTPGSTGGSYAVGGSGASGLRWLQVAPGATYYFAVTSNEGVRTIDTYAFTIGLTSRSHDVQEEALPYAYGDEEKNTLLTLGNDDFYTFTAPTSGDVLFESWPTGSFNFTGYIYHLNSQGAVVIDAETNVHNVVITLTKDLVYYLYFTTTWAASATAYMSFTFATVPNGANEATADTLTVTTAPITVSTNCLTYHYFAFTPTDTGSYHFTVTGNNNYGYKTLYVRLPNSGTIIAQGTDSAWDGTFSVDADLTGGTKYIVQVGYGSTVKKNDFYLQVTKNS